METVNNKRAAGILMPISSLPSPYGIGTMGKEARNFADFLKKSGQKIWQILPVGPTSYGDSPYQSFSTYAGNPYFIDLEALWEEGLLKKSLIEYFNWGEHENYVDYERVYKCRFIVLEDACARFFGNKKNPEKDDYEKFCEKNKDWLEDYALFMSVKAEFENKAWTEWDDKEIRLRKPEALAKYRVKCADKILFWKFVQFKFYQQWEKFRGYVNYLGIKILGDMPIYVAMDSADTWANPDVFWLDEEGKPVRVAGCPPDYFSAKGQLWGNPLYNWDYLKETGYEWWIKRVKAATELFDITRIDHFRAFDTYYAIPYPAEDAVNGEWLNGPGIKFFEKLKAELGDPEIVAEDLGSLADSVYVLLEKSGYPGMRVFEFAFDGDDQNGYLPHNYCENCVAYTGTHDNDTLRGWFEKEPALTLGRIYSECYPDKVPEIEEEEEPKKTKEEIEKEEKEAKELKEKLEKLTAEELEEYNKQLEEEEKKKERDRRLTIKYKQDAKLAEDLKLSDEEVLDMILTALYNSKANTVIIQLQDILWLGSEARMNTPSTLGDNWKWRASREYLTDEIAERLMNYAKNSNRI